MNDLFLRACRREPVERTPVWLMRQAGRYMEQYQEVRRQHSFLEMCHNPEIACEVTLTPVEILEVDAAILFSDLLIPVQAMGLEIEFKESVGPVIHNPVRTEADLERLHVPDPKTEMPFVMEAIRLLRQRLEVPLIGFAGAPFTVASYIIEGGGSRNYLETKRIMHTQPRLWRGLMSLISESLAKFLAAQVKAGAQALQVFDSWVGALSPEDYRHHVLPYSRRVLAAARGKVPVIHFASGAAGLLELLRQAGGDIIGVDWRLGLDTAWQRIGHDRGIQGNLDPALLFATPRVIEQAVKDLLARAEGRAGHIFNLGHGVLPATPVENVKALVAAVAKYSRRRQPRGR
ncbi:MAG: uroporphyrinogen decarboxylase [Pseudomonadota bacterium]